jgi:thiol-disulfide isomerase/thioredoxin
MGALLLTGCTDIAGTGDGDYVPGEGNVAEVAPGDREDPVEARGETVGGGEIDLAELRGQVVVVNVWWSLCGPCRSEMPMLVDAEGELPAEETEFVGINIRDLAPENAEAFERDRGVDYPSIYDPGSQTLDEFGRYRPASMPSTAILDREGRVAVLISGAVPSETTLLTLVEGLLDEDTDG